MNSFYTLITAHTGCDNTLPNTLESVVIGMDSGADFVEVDVRSTLDGIAVLFHDDHIVTRDSGMVRINDLTYSELNKLVSDYAISNSSIAEIIKLEEAISIVKNSGGYLNIDIKDDACIVPMIKLIREADMVGSTIITGCKYSRASALKRDYPEFQVLLNLDKSLLLDIDKSPQMIAEKICCMAVEASCCGINIEFTYLFSELIEEARRRFLPISIWTLTDSDNLERYLNMGFYSITTKAVRSLVEKRNNHIKKTALPGIWPEKI